MAKKPTYAELKANMARMEAMLAEQKEKTAAALAEALVDDDVMGAMDGLTPADIKKLAAEIKPKLVKAARRISGGSGSEQAAQEPEQAAVGQDPGQDA